MMRYTNRRILYFTLPTVAELLFFSCDLEPTLTFERDLDSLEMNQRAKYLGQR